MYSTYKGSLMQTRTAHAKLYFVTSVFALIAALVAPAQAYPPGQDLTVTSDKVVVRLKGNVTFRVTNAQPGSEVAFAWANVVRFRNAGLAGTSGQTFTANRVGVFTAQVTNGSEKARTKVWVPRIDVQEARTTRGSNNKFELIYGPAGAIVRIEMGNRTYRGTVGSNGVVRIPFTSPTKRGTYEAQFHIGSVKLGFITISVR
jgi:hypothetical protein